MKKVTFQIDLKNVLWLKRLKLLLRGLLVSDINSEEIVGAFYKIELQKANRREFTVEKVIKRKDDQLYAKWKGYDNSLIVGLIKKYCYVKMDYFPDPYTRSKIKIKIKLDLFNHATKSNWKKATDVDTSDFAKGTYLASLKPEVDQLDIDQLKNVPSGLDSLKSKVDKWHLDKLALVPFGFKKLSDVVHNDVVKKTVYNELS